MILDDLASEAKEQKTSPSLDNGWHKTFLRRFKQGDYKRALAYVEKRKIPATDICCASYDEFRLLILNGDKKAYESAARVFREYGFQHWIDFHKGTNRKLNKSKIDG